AWCTISIEVLEPIEQKRVVRAVPPFGGDLRNFANFRNLANKDSFKFRERPFFVAESPWLSAVSLWHGFSLTTLVRSDVLVTSLTGQQTNKKESDYEKTCANNDCPCCDPCGHSLLHADVFYSSPGELS